MTVQNLHDELEQLIADGMGFYDVMIKVNDRRDLIDYVNMIKSYSSMGYVELKSRNQLSFGK